MSLDDFNDSAVVQGTLRLARHFSLRLLMDMGPVHVPWLWIGLGVWRAGAVLSSPKCPICVNVFRAIASCQLSPHKSLKWEGSYHQGDALSCT